MGPADLHAGPPNLTSRCHSAKSDMLVLIRASGSEMLDSRLQCELLQLGPPAPVQGTVLTLALHCFSAWSCIEGMYCCGLQWHV